MNKDKTRAIRRKLRVRKKLNNIKKHKLLAEAAREKGLTF